MIFRLVPAIRAYVAAKQWKTWMPRHKAGHDT
jgi:hypothetical protein